MAYKKLIKVSNVCQLMDKRKYVATTTINGVAVSAKDNAFYVTGTCIQSGGRNNKLSETIVLRPGRYYFYTFNASEAVSCLSKNIDNSIIVVGNSNMFTVEETTECYFGINFVKDIVYSGYLKPQLFDLTEMYGAGHEPTTVEEFRQDFPEEMYDYSPHCWLTSYKRVIVTGNETYHTLTAYQRNLTCKTKNLFDISKYAGSYSSNATYELSNNSIKLNITGVDAYIGQQTDTKIAFKVEPNTTYYFSFNYTNTKNTTSKIIIGTFNSEKVWKNNIFKFSNGLLKGSFTTDDSTYYLSFRFGSNSVENEISTSIFSNIMVVKGDTPTDYVPYGHL